MNTIIKFNGQDIPVRHKENNVLENILLDKKEIRFQCKNGFCGNCRCKLISGEICYQKPKIGNTQSDEILVCIAKALDNLVLEQA
ncbi:2Fe-2S iron-sulfur cluster-binding protein [Francisellaceae bacterium]|nr:2Fe-2S iron-sulfur cluster-binding protein [Francisellaceae bacterium]